MEVRIGTDRSFYGWDEIVRVWTEVSGEGRVKLRVYARQELGLPEVRRGPRLLWEEELQLGRGTVRSEREFEGTFGPGRHILTASAGGVGSEAEFRVRPPSGGLARGKVRCFGLDPDLGAYLYGTLAHSVKDPELARAYGMSACQYICAMTMYKGRELAALPPEARGWLRRDGEGDLLLMHYRYPERYAGCWNSPEFREYEKRRMEEALRKADGIFWDNPSTLWNPCLCGRCREKFRAFSERLLGRPCDPPEDEDPYSPVWRTWVQFQILTGSEYFRELKVASGGAFFEPNHWHPLGNAWMDWMPMGEVSDVVFYEEEAWFYPDKVYMPTLKVGAALGRGRPVVLMVAGYAYGVNNPPYPAPTELQLRIALAEAAAYGGHSLFVFPRLFSSGREGTGYPPKFLPGNLEAVRRHWAFQAVYRELYEGTECAARIGVLYSSQTRLWFPETTQGLWGWMRALMDTQLPYEVVLYEDASPGRLSRYKVLVVPDLRCMGEGVADALRRYAEAGGTLVVTGEPGICDDRWWVREGWCREDYLLAELTGVHRGRERTVRRRLGEGWVVYLPEEYERGYWRTGDPDAKDVMVRAVVHGSGADHRTYGYFGAEVRVGGGHFLRGPLGVDVYRKGNKVSVHLVNYQYDVGRDRMTPFGDFLLYIGLPDGMRARRAFYLSPDLGEGVGFGRFRFDEKELKFKNYGDVVEVEVPGLEVYGLISVELG